MTSSSLPPIPPSPTQSYASTAFPTASLNLPSPPPPPHPNLYLSGSDVKSFIAAYESLTETAKAYRKELASVASAASAFGAALETCARCEPPPPSPPGAQPTGALTMEHRQGRGRYRRRPDGRLGLTISGC